MEKSKEHFEFKKQIQYLQRIKGEGTELISVYIPPGANVNEVTNRLRDEYGQALNIKSKQTKKNVQAAIDRILQTLRGINKPPANGVAIFCGNINGKIELFNIIPPEPINVQLYRCDNKFVLDPMLDLIETKEIYGIFTIDRRECTVAIMKGKNINILFHNLSTVPGKHGKGGQSQQRFERLIEIAAHEYFKKVGEVINQAFAKGEIRGVICAGPGPTKETFLKGEYLHTAIKNKIIGTMDVGYTDETGIKEVADRSDQILGELEINKEKELVKEFIEKISSRGLAISGEEKVKAALSNGQVQRVLLSEKLELEKVEEMSNLAEATHAEVEMVSIDTPEGEQFYKAFGGIGAVLRYRI